MKEKDNDRSVSLNSLLTMLSVIKKSLRRGIQKSFFTNNIYRHNEMLLATPEAPWLIK
jgi:hypothetical protein